MAEGDTWVNALIGAVVTIVGSGFVPFAAVVGGGVAGYLEGGDREQGVRVGAYAGLIALIPIALFAFLALTVMSFAGLGFGPDTFMPGMFDVTFGAGLSFAFLLLALVIGLVYFVAFSAIGGWLGNYIKYETDIGS